MTSPPEPASDLPTLLDQVAACAICSAHLPLGPRPVVQVGERARIALIGHAPGLRVHKSGVPWDDPSGERLREWLGISTEQFYDPDIVAIMPMGFCYPGRGRSGDNPPRPECAPQWHDALLGHLPDVRLTVVIGAHPLRRYVPNRRSTLTATVADWADHLPERIVLPHPSPRNQPWRKRNPWFERDVLPALRGRVAQVLRE